MKLHRFTSFVLESATTPHGFAATPSQLEEVRSRTFYHNTTKHNAESIRKNGFDLGKNVRGKHFGKGVYFSERDSDRWGEAAVQARVNPTKLLYDPEGDIQYFDTDLGRAVLQYADDTTPDFHTNVTPRQYLLNTKSNINHYYWEAIDRFMDDNGFDAMYTVELGEPILVARNTDMIKII